MNVCLMKKFVGYMYLLVFAICRSNNQRLSMLIVLLVCILTVMWWPTITFCPMAGNTMIRGLGPRIAMGPPTELLNRQLQYGKPLRRTWRKKSRHRSILLTNGVWG